MSFLSVEPQSIALLRDHSNSLLTQFDTQVDIIADRYLAFFKERRRIEAAYINSLRKLHRNAKIIDASFDPRVEPATTRAAWDTVRDNLEKEANAQQAFVDILDFDVIKPLAVLEELGDGMRKQIEEDLNTATAIYADYSEKNISKLQRAYSEKYHHRFRRRQEDSRGPEHARSEEVFDDGCRSAVAQLNNFRSMRVESLEGGYNCLEELVFSPTVKDVLVKYTDSISTRCAKYDNLATSTREEVKKALAGADTDLRVSFRRALSFSIPPLTLYRNNRLGAYSNLIFGVPLTELTTNQDNVPNVMRMCIEEVEERGLNTRKLYLSGTTHDAEVSELRRRFESEKSFSFSSTDNINSVATLLKLYLWDLPEPLFTLSLQDYRSYGQNRVRYTENNFPLLRSKIRELHPVQRESLGALLRHLSRVACCSDMNAMTVEILAARFRYAVLRGNKILQDGVHVKSLVMEDLIQHAHTLFDERPSPSPPVPSPHVSHTVSVELDLDSGVGSRLASSSRKRGRSIGSQSDGEQPRGIRLKQEPED